MEKSTDNTTEKIRTMAQNRAIHAYLTLVARELSNQGQTMEKVIEKIPLLEIEPTKDSVKTILWKPIQTALFGKRSTTELSTADVNRVYELLSMFLSKNFGISIPFPSSIDLYEN